MYATVRTLWLTWFIIAVPLAARIEIDDAPSVDAVVSFLKRDPATFGNLHLRGRRGTVHLVLGEEAGRIEARAARNGTVESKPGG